ncbi:hypothetical protein DFR49_0724 [Hephaestia caeni]|uniref:Uncharacterized protein n=1 Tax=Hephaestia caeni TaxID=645617 RepID=A0A397PKJ1_9SPHN|nr:hypothetical protein DFR49_0724 [Hephaestia caeni]
MIKNICFPNCQAGIVRNGGTGCCTARFAMVRIAAVEPVAFVQNLNIGKGPAPPVGANGAKPQRQPVDGYFTRHGNLRSAMEGALASMVLRLEPGDKCAGFLSGARIVD